MIQQNRKDEIDDLREHPHISSLSILNDQTIKVVYNPSETNSVYKDKSYLLEIYLPETYPEDPPSLKFQDPIYHLNINYESGEVRMKILQEDWSPFLSLTSVVESLDQIMEEPEQDCPCSSELLYEYETNRESYFNKVLRGVEDQFEALLCQPTEREVSEKINANHRKDEEEIGRDSARHSRNRSSQLVEELRQSMVQIEGGNYNSIHKVEGQGLSKRGRNRNFVSQEQIIGKKSISLEKHREESAGKSPIKDLLPRSKESKGFQRSSNDPKGLTLQKINETINIFLEEIEEIEKQIQSSTVFGTKSILKNRQQSQIQMLKQLVDMSDSIKKEMVRKIKEEASKF